MLWYLISSQPSDSDKYCTYCGFHNHNIEYCPKTWNGQGNINARRCSYCGSKEHTYEECRKHA